MSRLIKLTVTAALAAMLIAAEMKSPDITKLVIRGLTPFALYLLAAAGIGYAIARIRHHAAIRDAGVERAHEQRITAFRADEAARLAKDLAPFRLRDQHANKPGAN